MDPFFLKRIFFKKLLSATQVEELFLTKVVFSELSFHQSILTQNDFFTQKVVSKIRFEDPLIHKNIFLKAPFKQIIYLWNFLWKMSLRERKLKTKSRFFFSKFRHITGVIMYKDIFHEINFLKNKVFQIFWKKRILSKKNCFTVIDDFSRKSIVHKLRFSSIIFFIQRSFYRRIIQKWFKMVFNTYNVKFSIKEFFPHKRSSHNHKSIFVKTFSQRILSINT